MRVTTRSATAMSGALAALLIAASPALAGPLWISVEYPTNPHHPSTRNAAFLVHAYHHTTAIDTRITGRAEGLVDGRRTSVELEVQSTALSGVYAVSGLPKAVGDWVAVITITEENQVASAIVTLGPDGAVVDVDVPSSRSRDGWTVPRAATEADVATGLRQAAVLATAFGKVGKRPVDTGRAGLALLLLLPAGVVVAAGLRGRRSR